MKDPVHHRKAVQKQVIRSTRRANATSDLMTSTAPITLSYEKGKQQDNVRSNHDQRLDFDSKRKISLEFVHPKPRNTNVHIH